MSPLWKAKKLQRNLSTLKTGGKMKEHYVLSHDPLQGISLDKKKCSETIRGGSKKSWIEFNFFFEPFRSISFRVREQVNHSRVKDISRKQ